MRWNSESVSVDDDQKQSVVAVVYLVRIHGFEEGGLNLFVVEKED